MLNYSYNCSSCSSFYEALVPLEQYKEPQPCPVCGALNTKSVVAPHVIFKGDTWGDKNRRIKKQMAEKNKKIGERQKEMKHYSPPVTLAPNVEGERVGSWAEAQKLAKSKGKNTESYAPMVAKEKNKP